jgi:hypothetical protein
MGGALVCCLGSENVLEPKLRDPLLIKGDFFQYGELLAGAAFGLDVAPLVLGANITAHNMLTVLSAVVDALFIDWDSDVDLLPLFPFAVFLPV